MIGHPLVEQLGERADHAGLRLAPLAQEDHVVPGQQGVLELRDDRVLVAEHARRRAARRQAILATALRRTSSLTGSDCQPDSRSWPRVAGREDMPGTLPPRLRRRAPLRFARLLLASLDPIGASLRRPPHCGGPRQPGPRRLAAQADPSAPGASDGKATEVGVRSGRVWTCPAWRAALADDDLRRDAVQPEYDDDGWEPIAVPGHWRSAPAFADSDGPLIYRTRFELDTGPEHAPPLARARRHLLPRRRLARRGLPRRPRGLLPPARLRDHRPRGLGLRAPAVHRGDVRAPAGPAGQAEHHRRLPALGLHRPRLEPGRDLAARSRRAHGAGADQPPPGGLPRGQRGPGRPAARGRARHRATPATSAYARRWTTGWSGSSTTASPRAPTP